MSTAGVTGFTHLQSLPSAGPISKSERIGSLDILRGFALLGVLVANLIEFSGEGYMATAAQLSALPHPQADSIASFLVAWLYHDKANTLFAFLFGVGFWIMLERLEARGINFERIYLRRLTVLALFGFAHLLLIWSWDVLHLYAMAGFVLFAFRKASNIQLLIFGGFLLVFGRALFEWIIEGTGLAETAWEAALSDQAVLARQQDAGTIVDQVAAMAQLVWYDWYASYYVIPWFLYVLGRFLIGAYVARRGWLQNASALQPQFRRWCLILLPLGLVGEGLVALASQGIVGFGDTLDSVLVGWLHFVTVPVLAAGYLCLIVVIYHSGRWRRLGAFFAPVGQMALTNYVVQSVFIGFVLYQTGLGLAGQVGPAWLLVWALLFFSGQALISRYWLARFRFGPLEWCWRTLTYGERPDLRRSQLV